jgi:hypothetical protein
MHYHKKQPEFTNTPLPHGNTWAVPKSLCYLGSFVVIMPSQIHMTKFREKKREHVAHISQEQLRGETREITCRGTEELQVDPCDRQVPAGMF